MGIDKNTDNFLRFHYGDGYLCKALKDVMEYEHDSKPVIHFIGGKIIPEDEPGVIKKTFQAISDALSSLFYKVIESIKNILWKIIVEIGKIPTFLDNFIKYLEDFHLATGSKLLKMAKAIPRYIKEFWDYFKSIFGGKLNQEQQDAYDESISYTWISEKNSTIFKEIIHKLADSIYVIVFELRELVYNAVNMVTTGFCSIIDIASKSIDIIKKESKEYMFFMFSVISNPLILVGKSKAYVDKRMQGISRRFYEFVNTIREKLIDNNEVFDLKSSYLYKIFYGSSLVGENVYEWIVDHLYWLVNILKSMISTAIPWFKNLIFLIPTMISFIMPVFEDLKENVGNVDINNFDSPLEEKQEILHAFSKTKFSTDTTERTKDLVDETLKLFAQKQKNVENKKWTKKIDDIFTEEDISAKIFSNINEEKSNINDVKHFLEKKYDMSYETLMDINDRVNEVATLECGIIFRDMLEPKFIGGKDDPTVEELLERKKKAQEGINKQKIIQETEEIEKKLEKLKLKSEIEKELYEKNKELEDQIRKLPFSELTSLLNQTENELEDNIEILTKYDKELGIIQTKSYGVLINDMEKYFRENLNDLNILSQRQIGSLTNGFKNIQAFQQKANIWAEREKVLKEVITGKIKYDMLRFKSQQYEKNVKVCCTKWNFIKLKWYGVIGIFLSMSILTPWLYFNYFYKSSLQDIPIHQPPVPGTTKTEIPINTAIVDDSWFNFAFSTTKTVGSALFKFPVDPFKLGEAFKDLNELYGTAGFISGAFLAKLVAILSTISAVGVIGFSIFGLFFFICIAIFFLLLDNISQKREFGDSIIFYMKLIGSKFWNFCMTIARIIIDNFINPLITASGYVSGGIINFFGIVRHGLSFSGMAQNLGNLYTYGTQPKDASSSQLISKETIEKTAEEFINNYFPNKYDILPIKRTIFSKTSEIETFEPLPLSTILQKKKKLIERDKHQKAIEISETYVAQQQENVPKIKFYTKYDPNNLPKITDKDLEDSMVNGL